MPDDHDFDENDPDESSVIKGLRKEAKRAQELEAENKVLRSAKALFDAKLGNLSSLQADAVLATYKGDIADGEALRKHAADLGVHVEAPVEPEAPQVSAEEQAAHQRMAETTAAAPPSEAQTKTLNDRILQANSPEEVKAILDGEGMIRPFD